MIPPSLMVLFLICWSQSRWSTLSPDTNETTNKLGDSLGGFGFYMFVITTSTSQCYISLFSGCWNSLVGQLTRSPPALVEHRLSLQLAHVLLRQGPTPDQVPGQNQINAQCWLREVSSSELPALCVWGEPPTFWDHRCKNRVLWVRPVEASCQMKSPRYLCM